MSISWRSEILDWNLPFIFVDSQINGPYEMWVHTHRFTEIKNGTRVDDEVIYKVWEMVWWSSVFGIDGVSLGWQVIFYNWLFTVWHL